MVYIILYIPSMCFVLLAVSGHVSQDKSTQEGATPVGASYCLAFYSD